MQVWRGDHDYTELAQTGCHNGTKWTICRPARLDLRVRYLSGMKDCALLTNNRTARNSRESTLLRLPGELRNKIYKYSVGGFIIHSRPAEVTRDSNSNEIQAQQLEYCITGMLNAGPQYKPLQATLGMYGQAKWPTDGLPVNRIFNLSSTCRQIRSETASFESPYASNYFRFEDTRSYNRLLGAMLSH